MAENRKPEKIAKNLTETDPAVAPPDKGGRRTNAISPTDCLAGTGADEALVKRIEKALRDSENRYRFISENTLDMIWTLDLDLRFTYVNSAVYKIAGYLPEEFVGTHLSEHCDPDNFEMLANLALEEMEKNPEESGICFETVMLSKHRIPVPVEIHCKLICDDDGAPTGFHGTSRDISERTEREAANKQLQARLAQAKKMESVGRLAGGVAHDFNNMLSVIMGYAEVALAKVDPSDSLYTDITGILEAARRSTEITRQLLAFARQQNIAPQVIDINDTVDGILGILKRLAGQDVNLAWQPGADVWPVRLDTAQMDQILTNLCINARDAMAEDGTIIIETANTCLDESYCADHAGFRPGHYVLLTVSDDGAGMDRETLDNVFEPFFTTKDVGQGSGLGLSTVYGIVKQNQGFINVYSEPESGTTVKIYLPRRTDPSGKPDKPVRQGVVPGRGETILLVEDDPTILNITCDLLETLDYKVLATNLPEKALELAKNSGRTIELLITDVVMPHMNGRDLSASIVKILPNIKTLFMSGYTASIIARRGVLEDGLQFIQKPFSKEHLAAKIRDVLEN